MEGGMHCGRMALVSTHDCMQLNQIGDDGVRELARALEHNTSIKHLNVRVCRGDEGWECTVGLALMIVSGN